MSASVAGDAAPAVDDRAKARTLARWHETRLTGVALLALLLLLWECSARFGWVVSSNWPPVSAVLGALWQGIVSGELGPLLLGTLRRMATGYTAGCLAGVTLGLLLGASGWLRSLLRPPIEALRPIPAPAIIPPLILFLGVDDALKIFIVALASFFPAFVNTLAGVGGIDDVLLQTARTFRAGWWRTLVRVILPATLPAIAAGLRTALSLALVVAVIAEMIAGSSGAGYYIVQMQYAMKPDAMYAVVFCLSAIGYGLNRGFLALEAGLIPWMGRG